MFSNVNILLLAGHCAEQAQETVASRASYTLCLKKVPTFKLSVTLSNVNQFSKIVHRWKAYEICYKTHTTLYISL